MFALLIRQKKRGHTITEVSDLSPQPKGRRSSSTSIPIEQKAVAMDNVVNDIGLSSSSDGLSLPSGWNSGGGEPLLGRPHTHEEVV